MATIITLNGTALSEALIWQDREAYAPVVQGVERTLGGRLVVDANSVSQGRPITLASARNQGWLDYATVKVLQGLAEVVGGMSTLVIGSDSYTVMFRHEEAPAFEATPLIKRLNPADDDWFLVTIKLMTV